MAKLARLIIRIRAYIEKIEKADAQPELATAEMSEYKELVLRQLFSQLGDTVKQIPLSERERFPDVPWRRIGGFRDELVHNYEEINPEIIRGVLDGTHLQELLEAVEQMNPDVELPRRRSRSRGSERD